MSAGPCEHSPEPFGNRLANDTTGGFSIVVKTSAGTGVSVPPSAMVDVYSDGTNAVQAANYWTGSIGGIAYLDAGADIALVSLAESVPTAQLNVIAAINDGRIPMAQVDRSVARVLTAKGITGDCPA